MPTPSHALILTAGLGTRLEPLTTVRAKPAFPVGGQPLIQRIVAHLVGYGVTNITMNLHHLPQTITAVVGDGHDLGAAVRYSWELPRILGSAGGPRQALDIVGADTFFLVNGDTVSDVDLDALSERHQSSRALVTMALVPNTRFLHYGGVQVSDDGDVIGFVSRGPGAEGTFHFFGTQIVDRAVFAGLRQGEPAASVGGVYDQLIAERSGRVRAFVCDARYWDIGTIADYWTTAREFQYGDANAVGTNVRLADSATVRRSLLWDDVTIGDGVVLDECILADGVRLENGARFHRSILIAKTDGDVEATPF